MILKNFKIFRNNEEQKMTLEKATCDMEDKLKKNHTRNCEGKDTAE